jgi:phosphate starvation-inducible membrane PsiE
VTAIKTTGTTKTRTVAHFFIVYSWFLVGVLFLLIVAIIGYNILKTLGTFGLSNIKVSMDTLFLLSGGLLLFQELAVLSFTTVKEGGHFPLRYIFLFGIIASIIGIVLKSKSPMNTAEMQVLTCIIIVFTIVYFGIKIINKKYDLKH